MKIEKIIDEDAGMIAESSLLNWKKLSGKTILVSGATGYVPSYFIFALMKRNTVFGDNIKIIALCRDSAKAKRMFGAFLDDENFELLIQDVVEAVKYKGLIHYYIHAASPAGYFSRHEKPADTFNANVTGCKNLLEHAINNDIEGFLLLSSVDVYGRNVSVTRLAEESYGYLDPMDPRGSYSSSKLASEALCKAYCSQYKIPCKIVRPFQILGNTQNLSDGRLHVDFASQLLKHNKIILKGDGTPLRTFMYINDAIIAMLKVLFDGEPGEVYNICDEEGECSVLQLAELMLAIQSSENALLEFDKSQREKIEVVNVIPTVLGDSSKLRDLGFKSHFSLESGLKRIMQGYGIEIN